MGAKDRRYGAAVGEERGVRRKVRDELPVDLLLQEGGEDEGGEGEEEEQRRDTRERPRALARLPDGEDAFVG